MPRPDLSVVVPTLDEAEALPALLAALAAQRGIALETIVADGGSTDATPAIAAAHGARVVAAPRGRGAQMNAGAAVAAGEWLLFLHADCRPTADDQLRRALDTLRARPDRRTAGHFALRFERTGADHDFLYRYMEAKSATGRPHSINGDQGTMVPAAWFRALGGFDESLPFLEDQRFAARVREHGTWRLLPGRLATSARRFEREGAGRRYLLMAIIMGLYAADLRAFFERAPDVYRVQAETDRVLLTPYFRLIRRLMREMGAREALRRWYAVGGFVAEQTWQPCLALELLLARPLGGRRPVTALHDLGLDRLVRHPPGRALVGAATLVVSLGLLAPWRRWRERDALRRIDGRASPGR
ncbi:family 2 glycosyl transferase [Salinisphaera sp. PC39]|uniref:TIGR04283 family arsenosugar biosynthesis glycosyltransferase n=1 Tax=Salinisphaera sp. PC39 TaxID=1304156 RepID=UPI00333F375A